MKIRVQSPESGYQCYINNNQLDSYQSNGWTIVDVQPKNTSKIPKIKASIRSISKLQKTEKARRRQLTELEQYRSRCVFRISDEDILHVDGYQLLIERG